ncbi:hypothetical protein N9924_00695 [bacterium]|nr:hypothetical protein [bacterium]
MSDITLNPISSGYNLSKINENFTTLEDVVNDEVVHSTGGNNVMQQELDMNSRRILNVGAPINDNDGARLKDVLDGLGQGIGSDLVGVVPKQQVRQTGNGVQTEFDQPSTNTGLFPVNLFIYFNGVRQRPYTDYTLNPATPGKVLFSTAPLDGTDIDILLYEPAVVDDLRWYSRSSYRRYSL